jgi:hypothetical protein
MWGPVVRGIAILTPTERAAHVESPPTSATLSQSTDHQNQNQVQIGTLHLTPPPLRQKKLIWTIMLTSASVNT